jgi:hypothetical protein
MVEGSEKGWKRVVEGRMRGRKGWLKGGGEEGKGD